MLHGDFWPCIVPYETPAERLCGLFMPLVSGILDGVAGKLLVYPVTQYVTRLETSIVLDTGSPLAFLYLALQISFGCICTLAHVLNTTPVRLIKCRRTYFSIRPFPFLWIQIERLRHQLSQVQRGEAFLLHAGDCAESFNACTYVSFLSGFFFLAHHPCYATFHCSSVSAMLSLLSEYFPSSNVPHMQSMSALVIVSAFRSVVAATTFLASGSPSSSLPSRRPNPPHSWTFFVFFPFLFY